MTEPTKRRDVVITGIGVVSALGDGRDATWQGLVTPEAGQDLIDCETFKPFCYYKPIEVDLSTQIPKRGDLRQMELWQRLGVYAAGRALDDAGLKDDAARLDTLDMIVAAGGGERDLEVDHGAMQLVERRGAPDAELNEFLATNLRPTLFLTQLPNLLAGNISIVHGVMGSSRTFMGEELSGADALRIAHSRIAAGQSDITLVGGAYNGARPDVFLLFALTGQIWRGTPGSVWQRKDEGGGFVLGSGGAFLVLESADHAEARGATPIARLGHVSTDRTRRRDGQALDSLTRQWQTMRSNTDGRTLGVVSGATGGEPATGIERAFLAKLSDERGGIPVRAPASRTGHLMEAECLLNVALAAIMLDQGTMSPADPHSDVETGDQSAIDTALVTCLGNWRGEGLVLLDKAPR